MGVGAPAGLEIVTRLSSGGMGEVLLAVRRGAHGFEKLIAVKTIRTDLQWSAEMQRMFQDEARLLAGLDHPAIAQVYDFVEQSGVLYLTMEYVPGVPLHRLLARRGALPPAVAARLVADACRGLHAAHELADAQGHPLGVVHRDVSPQNLMLTFDGRLKVLDFGVAFMRGRQASDTQPGVVKGKLSYAAPEQIAGGEVDRRSDLYSLSVVFFECLTGARLFPDAAALLVENRRDSRLPRPSASGAPRELDPIVRRGLALKMDDRWPDARVMAAALDEWLARTGGESLERFAERELAEERERHRAWLQELRAARAAGTAPPTPPRALPALPAFPEAGGRSLPVIGATVPGSLGDLERARPDVSAGAPPDPSSASRTTTPGEAPRSERPFPLAAPLSDPGEEISVSLSSFDPLPAALSPGPGGDPPRETEPAVGERGPGPGKRSTAWALVPALLLFALLVAGDGLARLLGVLPPAPSPGPEVRTATIANELAATPTAAAARSEPVAAQPAPETHQEQLGTAPPVAPPAVAVPAPAALTASTASVGASPDTQVSETESPIEVEPEPVAEPPPAARPESPAPPRRRPAAPTKATPSAKWGQLSLIARPGGSVLIDGRRAGGTPLHRFKLKPGLHEVALQRPGDKRPRWLRTLRIHGGVHLSIQLR